MLKIGPKHRICRRVGAPVCGRPNCASNKRPYPPGQHGQGRRRLSEYHLRLLEKQKLRAMYGVTETQFRRYFNQANRHKGVTGTELLRLLETRLDAVVLRMGFAQTMRQARQLASHGHFTVDGKRVNVPSYQVSKFDIVDVKPKSLNTLPFVAAKESFGDRPIPGWLQVVQTSLRILVHQLPERAQIDVPVQEQLIVEFYSK